jgi:hypothetical protein
MAVALAWAFDAAAEWLQGERAPLLKFISFFIIVITIGAAGLASATWRWVWRRFPIIERKTFPDLSGTWEGTLVTTWIDPSTGRCRRSLQIYGFVRASAQRTRRWGE